MRRDPCSGGASARPAGLGDGMHGQGGKIVAIDALADPDRLRQLDLTVLDG